RGNRPEHRARGAAGRHPARGLLSRLAGITDATREARGARDSGLKPPAWSPRRHVGRRGFYLYNRFNPLHFTPSTPTTHVAGLVDVMCIVENQVLDSPLTSTLVP